MNPKLFVVSPDGQTKAISFDRARITVGRRAGNDLHFERVEISGNHAAFFWEEDRYFVIDLGSTNGTLLNGAQLVAQQKYALEDGDVINIAPYLITFRLGINMIDTVEEDMPAEQPRVGFGTVVDRNRVSTGTEEHEKQNLPLDKTVSKPDVKPLPPPPPPVAHIEPPPKPSPQPPPAKKGEELTATARPDQSAKKRRAGMDYLWLGLGALILLAALAVIALILMA